MNNIARILLYETAFLCLISWELAQDTKWGILPRNKKRNWVQDVIIVFLQGGW